MLWRFAHGDFGTDRVADRVCRAFVVPAWQVDARRYTGPTVPTTAAALVGGVDLSPLVLLVLLQIAAMVLGSVQFGVLH